MNRKGDDFMKAITHNIVYKFVSLALAVAMLFGIGSNCLKADGSKWKTNYTYVFVHGRSGWGSYDEVYKLVPYWGILGGDLMEYLTTKGFHTYAASVAPTDSAWDRACELYAQLTGARVDYGKAHCERCGHARFGEDFSGRALIPAFSAKHKINLLGHSFGGATVRTFAAIMANGSAEEKKATPKGELSPYFAGGKADWIYSLTTLAAPHNGTTAYCYEGDPEEERSLLQKLMGKFKTQKEPDRIESDSADYDMVIDNALALNKTLPISKNTYYFSFACSSTKKQADGTYVAINSKTEPMFRSSANRLGKLKGVTEGGAVYDESWRENDGLVNTISAKAPFGQPQQEYNSENVPRGVWNVMPVVSGDHMSLEGGFMHAVDIKPFYLEHLNRINSL